MKRYRPSSAAFEDDSDGNPMSVYVARVVRESGASDEVVLAGHAGYGLAAVTARFARQQKQALVFEEAEIPGHAVVVGVKTKSISRAFAKQSNWIFLPPDRRTAPEAS